MDKWKYINKKIMKNKSMLNYKSRYSAKPTFPETGGGSTSIRIRVIVAGGG